jgi:hypothetical protein
MTATEISFQTRHRSEYKYITLIRINVVDMSLGLMLIIWNYNAEVVSDTKEVLNELHEYNPRHSEIIRVEQIYMHT